MEDLCKNYSLNEDDEKYILLMELSGFLHDIGKMDERFVLSNSEKITRKFYHNRDIFKEKYELKFSNFENFNKLLEEKVGITENISLKELIENHHYPDSNIASNKELELLIKSDNISSAMEKSNTSTKGQNYIINSFGKYEKKIFLDESDNYTEKLKDFIKSINDGLSEEDIVNEKFKKVRNIILENLENYGKNLLGETRFPLNDVTLYDHSYYVGTMAKTFAFARKILNEGELYKKVYPFKIFGIYLGTEQLIKNAYKPVDIKAYINEINVIKKELKRYIEEELLFGNLIYEDSNTVLFSYPNINNNDFFECVKREIRSLLDKYDSMNYSGWHIELSRETRIFTNAATFAKKISFPIYNKKFKLDVNNKDNIKFCPNCHVNIVSSGERCHQCNDRKRNHVKDTNKYSLDYYKNPKNGTIAALRIDLGLENWLNGKFITTRFINKYYKNIKQEFESITKSDKNNINKFKKILKKINDEEKTRGETKKKIYYIKMGNFEFFDNNKNKLLEVLDFEDTFINKNKNSFFSKYENISFFKSLISILPSPARIQRIIDISKDFMNIIKDEIKKILPSEENIFEIIKDHEKMILLLPSNYIEDILVKIQEKYEEYFSVVKHMLPIYVNVLFYKDSTPFIRVYEGLRRFEENNKKLYKNPKIVKFNEVKNNETIFTMEKDLFKFSESVKVSEKNIKAAVNEDIESIIRTFLVKTDITKTGIDSYIKINENIINPKIKTYKELKSEEKVIYYPSYFDFEYLDTMKRISTISLKKKDNKFIKNTYYGINLERPVYINYLTRKDNIFEALKNLLKKKSISKTGIKQLEMFFMNYMKELDDEREKLNQNDLLFDQKLIEAIIIKSFDNGVKNHKDDVIYSVKNGVFFDFIELYMRIYENINYEEDKR
ncbi:CRISPR-associated protein, Csx11 family [Marinitoga hydrogenitolerans DSM 16785]|uniref:CRISPR-associated protein, Csx11 family n=1 Tax=Marinitoga hydrogenitolerans (strain DSM 16785 / JCM 12826 / AT1271) TaxID=1122195 RepID=A0A1M5AG67_MARH1|nr:hypothetical protein [Marinitoga hydrogenitolerans]SHF29145.1 CRISPR-associated protein, Csx11 family [Marinitoga hydrogenitolerans DSM 16785]